MNKYPYLATIHCTAVAGLTIIYRVLSRKGIEFLSQNLIFLSLYLCISISETLDISKYELFRSDDNSLKYQRLTPSGCKDIAI